MYCVRLIVGANVHHGDAQLCIAVAQGYHKCVVSHIYACQRGTVLLQVLAPTQSQPWSPQAFLGRGESGRG